jgi:hypothetical protein
MLTKAFYFAFLELLILDSQAFLRLFFTEVTFDAVTFASFFTEVTFEAEAFTSFF